MSTATDVVEVIQGVSDVVLAGLGLSELQTVVNEGEALIARAVAAIQAKQASLTLETAAADVAADAAVEAKFPKG